MQTNEERKKSVTRCRGSSTKDSNTAQRNTSKKKCVSKRSVLQILKGNYLYSYHFSTSKAS